MPYLVQQAGAVKGVDSTTIDYQVTVPFTNAERDARVLAAIGKAPKKDSIAKVEQYFDAMNIRESRPGDYAVTVEYAPAGQRPVVSQALRFTVKDKGNLYAKTLNEVR